MAMSIFSFYRIKKFNICQQYQLSLEIWLGNYILKICKDLNIKLFLFSPDAPLGWLSTNLPDPQESPGEQGKRSLDFSTL